MSGRTRRDPAPFRILKREVAYQGRVIRVVREVIDAAGHQMVRDTIEHPGSVVIVPQLPDGRLVFIRQYRRAVGGYLLELPAGTVTPGEPRLRCAKRELEEETGWRAARWKRLGQFYPAPGFLAEFMTIFLATGLSPGPSRPEPDELIEPVIVSLPAALAKIRTGAICDAKSILGVLFVARLSSEEPLDGLRKFR